MSRRSIGTIANALAASDADHAELLLNNTELEDADSVVKALKVLQDAVEDLINNDSEMKTEVDTQGAAVALNTAKTGITSSQASAITANTAKTSFPGLGTRATEALAGNTTTISSSQASAITANTAKVGFTTTMPTATEDHTIKFTVSNDGRGNYTLVITVADNTDADRPVTKTAEIILR